MKRAVLPGILLLLLVTLPLHAFRIASVDEVLRLHRAGVSAELIEEFVQAAEPFEVTTEDVIAMEEAGLPAQLIDAVVAAGERELDSLPDEREATTELASEEAEETPSASQEGEWCRTFDPPVESLIAQYFFPPWLWDPFWFMPRFDSRIAAGPDPRIERTQGERPNGDLSRVGSPRAERHRPGATRPESTETPRLEPADRRPVNINTAVEAPERGSSQAGRLPQPPMRPN